MSLFWDYTLNGVASGMIYAALALALVLSYRATKIINFAQGAAGMLTTFIAFSLLTRGWSYWPAFVAVLLIGFAIGAATDFSHFDLFILCAVLAMMLALLVLFRFTALGLRMRASAFSREIARLLGVRVGLLLTLGWGLAGIAGSLAGLLVAPTSAFGPYYMNLILVYAFTAAVIGGLESPVGALVGGLITGLCISYVGGYLGSGVEPAGALVLLIAALMVRPEGIFSRPPARRV